MDLNTLRHLGRFKEILVTLGRFGFGEVVERLELPERFIPFASPREHEVVAFEERVRMLMEALGPTFIKLGQILSLRPDLVPPKLIIALRKLQGEVEPVDFVAIKPVVEECLARPLSEIYSTFEEKPLASASMGQVHRAVLRTEGQPVAVKILKPGIKEKLRVDLSILEDLAETLDGKIEALEMYDLPGIVREIKSMLLRELDFEREARNIGIITVNLADMEGVRIPHVYSEYSGQRVLTMELFVGRVLGKVEPQELRDREELARLGLRVVLKQILEDGFFHADPHPGNLMLLDSGEMGIIDWGMVGRVTRSTRQKLISMIHAVEQRDSERIIEVILQITDSEPPAHMEMLERDILDVIDSYINLPVGKIQVGILLLELTALFREYGITIPAGLATVVKALLSGEGSARLIYPDLDVIAEARPMVVRLAKERFSLPNVLHALRRTLESAWRLHSQLPSRLDNLVRKAERGEISVRLKHENLTGLRETMETASNRLSLAIILAALFLGSSMIINSKLEPLLFGYPALGVLGYFVSGILGLGLVIIILRRKKF
jgi:ubiquinone biosynthesis protein